MWNQVYFLGLHSRKNEITKADVAAQALIFFFAGFDAVSNVMSFLAYELAINPYVQRKLRCEIMQTSEEGGKTLTYELISSMKYLEMVILGKLCLWGLLI